MDGLWYEDIGGGVTQPGSTSSYHSNTDANDDEHSEVDDEAPANHEDWKGMRKTDENPAGEKQRAAEESH